MSIATMNWALRQRLSSAHQQILLYVIADSADPNGITRHCDPGYLEEHSRMTRSTMFRRLGELEDLGLLQRLRFYSERGAPMYEIRLVLSALVDVPIKRRKLAEDDAGDEDNEAVPESQPETMVAETKVSVEHDHNLTRCDYISPPLSKELPPTPLAGGLHSKAEGEGKEKRDDLWRRFALDYPNVATMDQQAAREELDALSIEDAEWAISVLPDLKAELRKASNRPPKNAHLWLRKGMFRNFARRKISDPPPEGVWVMEGSAADQALRFVRSLAKAVNPLVRSGPDGSRGYLHKTIVGDDLLAMLDFEHEVPLRWTAYERGSPMFAAWQRRFTEWIGRGLPIEPGSDCIRAPYPWPPRKDGTWPITGPPQSELSEEDMAELK
jgi:hypothetical protein